MASKFKPEPLLYFPTGVLKWGKVRLRTCLTDTPYTCRIILNGGKNCWKVETSLRCIYQTQFCWSVMYFLYSSFHHSCYWHEEGEIERLLLPVKLGDCLILTSPTGVSRLLSTGDMSFSSPTCPWEYHIRSSLDFQTLKPGCWVSFLAGPLTPYVSLGKLLKFCVFLASPRVSQRQK